MEHLISFLIVIPLVAALVAAFIPSGMKTFRWIALLAGIAQTIVFIAIFFHYDAKAGGFQLAERITWISLSLGTWGELRIEYLVALDGLSLPLTGLSVIVMIVAVISSWKQEKNTKGYFILLLILNAAIIGTFCALDLFLFYIFFEFMLLPMYFLIGIWGGARREYASLKFLLYTLFGSVLILIVMIGLVLSTSDPVFTDSIIHTFNMVSMSDPGNILPGSVLSLDAPTMIGPWTARTWAFILLLIGFGIKLPLVPFHTWLPDAHVEAPTAISVVLSALLLKVGGYGLLRLAYPVFPEIAFQLGPLVAGLGVLSIVYGGLNALACKDLKRLIAYSSVSHMGFVLLGIASATTEGITGAVYQMFSHGLITAMLFLLAGVLQDRTGDRTIENYSGLSIPMRSYTFFILVAFFASLGLPGFSGFIAEVMVLLGAFRSVAANEIVPAWIAFTSILGLILGAGYYLWTIQRMFYGPLSVKVRGELTDLNAREYALLLPLAIAVLFFGIVPQPLIDIISPFADGLQRVLMNFYPAP